MMLSPTSVPPCPVSMPSQVSGSIEAQQTQSLFHGMQGNPVEGIRESQGMMAAEQRPMPQPQPLPQPLRELSAPRMASSRFPVSQQAKPDLEQQAGTVDRQPVHTAPMQESEASSTHRTAPTSLNQLLDNSGIQNMAPRPMQSSTARDVIGKDKSALDPELPLHCNSQSTDITNTVATTGTMNESEAKPKPALPIPVSSPHLQPASVPTSHLSTNMKSSTTPSLNQNPISTLSSNPSPIVNPTATLCSTLGINTNASMSPSPVTSGQSIPSSAVSTSSTLIPGSSSLKPSPSPKPVTSAHSVIQIPASSSTISPNQITVFVTSNPITSAPTSMVSTMVAVPNKNIRPQDIRQQAPIPRTPQFITTTPVFINPIFQVPGASVAPNNTVVSHSVTMMGPIQVSTTNIQLSAAPSSTQSSGSNMTSTQPARSTGGQVQISTNMSSTAPVGNLPAPQQINPGGSKTDNLNEAGSVQKTGPLVQQPSPHPIPPVSSPFQSSLVSAPPCSSPGAVNTIRKSPMSPPPAALVKSKPAQAAVAVIGAANSQQSPVERPAQGPTGAVPLHPVSPAIQIEAVAPHTTASTNNSTLPAVSSPIPVPGHVAVPTLIVTQALAPVPASISSPSKAATSHTPVVTVVGSTTGVSSANLLSTVAPVQSPVPSIVPIVAGPGPIHDVPPTTSSPVANVGGIPSSQSDPPLMESSLLPARAPPETSQTTPGKHRTVYAQLK